MVTMIRETKFVVSVKENILLFLIQLKFYMMFNVLYL